MARPVRKAERTVKQGKTGKQGDGKNKGVKGKDGTSKAPSGGNGQPPFEGYCNYCQKWGHRKKECRIFLKDQKSNASGGDVPMKAVGEVEATKEKEAAEISAEVRSIEPLDGWVF